MACSIGSLTMESYEEPTPGRHSSERTSLLKKGRRHSSYHTMTSSWNVDQENVQLMVDHFLAELSRRLEFIESYGHLRLDAGIERAYSTLYAVRDSCAHVSDEVLGAGRRRAKVLVETLEERYNDAIATRGSLEAKVQEGVKMMESMLADFEARAYTSKASIRTAAGDFIDESWRKVDESLERAGEVMQEGIERARRARHSMQISVEHAIALAKEHRLIHYNDLPVPWRVNPHILKGYRFHETKIDCVRSLLRPHNEFVNIWSHLLGLVLVLALAFYFYPTSINFSHSTKADIFVSGCFFFAACKCLVCSTMWHTFNSISEQNLMERFACVDYTGISMLVAASIMTTEYTAFYCEPVSRYAYMLTTAALGIGGVILPWHPTFNRADMAWARVGFYVSLAATGFLPWIQLSWTRGVDWAIYFYAPVTKSLLVYLSGAILYAGKMPERWFPGWFDYFGGSHNIWHLAVLGGILFHYYAMQEFFARAFDRAQGGCSYA